MVCNGYVAGRIAASRGLATFSNLEMQHSPKIFCIFLQKVLAKNTVDEAVRLNATDPDSLQSLYRRTYADVPLLPPLENKVLLPQQKVIPFRNDLKMLDAALKKGGVSNG